MLAVQEATPTEDANENIQTYGTGTNPDEAQRYIDEHLGIGDVVRLKSCSNRSAPVLMTVEEVLTEDLTRRACVVYFDGEGKLHRDKIRTTSLVYA